MIELPEAIVLSKQVNEMVTNKEIVRVIAEQSPHKFAWYHKDPQQYGDILEGRSIQHATAVGGLLELQVGDAKLVFSDGVNLRYFPAGSKRPIKHQLLLELEDESALCASVQMYGGLSCYPQGEEETSSYYMVAKSKPSPLSKEFDEAYFEEISSVKEVQKSSVKAFLATEQRIPGLGNGVLQDILWTAKLHPKRKMNTLSGEERAVMFRSIKDVLLAMTKAGGRDTEKNLFGIAGGYETAMSRNHVGEHCHVCGQPIIKDAYLGGSVYYCENCQKLS